MLSTLSSNVILSKARAMYGRHLTVQNYKELLNCRTVIEVAHYLKVNTCYEKILSGINENDIHRGQLELRLKQKLFEDSASLCRYELSVGEHFSHYLLCRNEIEQILHSLMLLNAGRPEEYIFSMPVFLNSHSHIDLPSLANVRNFEDVLNALGHTPYRKILESFRPLADMPLNYTGIENALYTYLYQSLYSNIKQYTHGEAKRQLYEIFDTYLDLHNYVSIVRLKTYYQAGPDFIRSCLLPFGSLRETQLNQLLAAEDVKELQSVMKKTVSGRRALRLDYNHLDELPHRQNYLICRRNIHFSTHPSVVMLSYIFLAQMELMDIINIVEGIRYQMPSAEIEKLLTAVKFQ